jgi:hypothetical protein
MNDRPEWFAPKRYGYGPGRPISWQGWAVTIAFCLMVLAATAFLLPRSPIAFVSAIVTLTVIFLFVGVGTTRGGARWRWGEDD